jgi:hypothetical protein
MDSSALSAFLCFNFQNSPPGHEAYVSNTLMNVFKLLFFQYFDVLVEVPAISSYFLRLLFKLSSNAIVSYYVTSWIIDMRSGPWYYFQ